MLSKPFFNLWFWEKGIPRDSTPFVRGGHTFHQRMEEDMVLGEEKVADV